MEKKEKRKTAWTFLTNHSHVLLCLARSRTMLMRDIANEVGITERAVQSIIADLRDEGFVSLRREGRRNAYEIRAQRHLKHSIEEKNTLEDVIQMVLKGEK